MQQRTTLVSFYQKFLDNDVRSDDAIRSVIAFAIRWQQNSGVNRNLTNVLNISNNCSERFQELVKAYMFLQDQ